MSSTTLIIYNLDYLFRLSNHIYNMGGTQSSTTINQLSQQLTNVAMSTVQDCSSNISQDQTVTDVNTGIWLWSTTKLEQTSEIRSECFSSSQKQAQLQNNIINSISQTATSEGVALLSAFGKTNAEANANLTNIIRNNITMSNIQKTYNAIKQKQSVSFNNSGIMGFRQVDLTQGAKIFAAATLDEIDKAGVFNAIETKLNQNASAKSTNPLDFIADVFRGIATGLATGATSSILFFIFIIIAIILVPTMMIRLLFSGQSSASPTMQPVEQTTEQSTGQPVEQTTDQPMEQSTEQSMEQTTEQPVEKPVEQVMPISNNMPSIESIQSTATVVKDAATAVKDLIRKK